MFSFCLWHKVSKCWRPSRSKLTSPWTDWGRFKQPSSTEISFRMVAFNGGAWYPMFGCYILYLMPPRYLITFICPAISKSMYGMIPYSTSMLWSVATRCICTCSERLLLHIYRYIGMYSRDRTWSVPGVSRVCRGRVSRNQQRHQLSCLHLTTRHSWLYSADSLKQPNSTKISFQVVVFNSMAWYVVLCSYIL